MMAARREQSLMSNGSTHTRRVVNQRDEMGSAPSAPRRWQTSTAMMCHYCETKTTNWLNHLHISIRISKGCVPHLLLLRDCSLEELKAGWCNAPVSTFAGWVEVLPRLDHNMHDEQGDGSH